MVQTETFQCERHPFVSIEVGSMVGCADCLAMLNRNVGTMTGDEKAAEVASWLHDQDEHSVRAPPRTHRGARRTRGLHA